jgi:predicted ribosomally synthesized peptide with SipW-like signal peptide
MGRLRLRRWAWLVITIFLFLFLAACGGHKPPGSSPFPAKVTLNPNPSYSLQLGSTLVLTASAQNGSGTNIRSTFTYAISPSSPAGVLDVAPNGFACAGTWNAPAYTICTPANTGVVQVTASALGATSAPTYIFVHSPIDNIQVSIVPPVNSPPPACPNQQALPPSCNLPFNGNASNYCLSQNQVQTLQATAYSGGVDITGQVGPFTWTQASPSVAKITPFVTVTPYNVPTNQATASPTTPGQTQVIASASGVYSQPFNFEACPVQCIALELSVNGQYTDQTSFIANKGTSETIAATAVDVQGCIVPKPPLTWVSSQPAVISTGSGTSSSGSGATNCGSGTTCSVSTPQPGASAITASCTPPTCNIGFPLNLANLPAPYIPQPVYPVTAISGLVTGAPTSTGVLATSQDCSSDELCAVALYNVSTSTNLPGSATELPTPPNSLLFDAAGSEVFMGSEFGAFSINPSGFGGSTSPFTPLPAPGTTLGLVTGKVLAVSPSGTLALFSDTVSTPNQVYVVTSSPQSTTALNINSATAAAISPDGLETLLLGNGGNSLYAYSNLQYLQTVQPNPLPSPAKSMAFNSTGSFALLSGGSPAGSLAIYDTCDNSLVMIPYLPASSIPTPPLFLKMVPAGNVALGSEIVPIPLQTAGLDFFFGVDNTGIDIIATTSSQPLLTALCPQPIALAQTTAKTPFAPVHININQGTFEPINFFLSPNATQAYIVTTNQGVLVYDFNTNSVSRIQLLNDATPIAADMTVDGTLIYVAGSDGLLHQLNTVLGVDLYQTSFVPLPDSSNNFCFTGSNCALNIVVVKP